MDEIIAVEEIAPQPVAAIRVTTAPNKLAEVFNEVLPETWAALQALGVSPAGPPFARYYRFDEEAVEVEAGLPTERPIAGRGRVQPGELPGGRVAVAVHVGHYDTLRETHDRLLAWMEQNGIAPGDGPWEVYETDPGDEPDPARWRTRVFRPIAVG